MTEGVVFVACGEKAEAEMYGAVRSMVDAGNVLPFQRIGRDFGKENKISSRNYKVNMLRFAEFDHFVYLDADTRPHASLEPIFAILRDGWDIVITPSTNQDGEAFWHVSDDEKQATLEEVGVMPVQLQCGMMGVAKNERSRRLFEAWNNEWLRYSGEDQAAFIRALYQCPVKVWLMGYPWNGGAAIDHRFGVLR